MNDDAEILLIIPAAILGIAMFAQIAYRVVWAYQDAERRGKSGCLVAILVAFLSWPIGLVAWLIFRPDRRRR